MATASTRLASHGGFPGKAFFPAARGFYFDTARSIAVENANDAGKSLATSLKRKRRALNDMYFQMPFACASGL